MRTREFWIQTAERAVRTWAQACLALAGATAFDVLTADWQALVGVSTGAALLSVATSIVASGVGDKGSPSLVES
jgi:hypothetical protein